MSVTDSASQGRGLRAEIAWVGLAFVLVNVASVVFQEPTSIRGGRGTDGTHYSLVAEQLARGERPETRPPFVYRVAVPFAASLGVRAGFPTVDAFFAVNGVGNALALVLLVVWLRLHLRDGRVRLFLALLFVTQWHGPVRFVHFYPTVLEPWVFVMVLGGLIAIERQRAAPTPGSTALLCTVAFVGAMMREAMLLLPVALLFAANPVARGAAAPFGLRLTRVPASALLPLAFGIAGLALARGLGTATGFHSFVLNTIHFAFEKGVPSYLLGVFVAFGPIVAIACYFGRTSGAWLASRQHLAVFLSGTAVLAWVGGTDTERLLYWAAPVVFVLVGRAFEEHADALRSPALLVVLVVGQAVSQRLFWATPEIADPSNVIPVLTAIGAEATYLDLLSFRGNPGIKAIGLLQYLALTAVLLAWIDRRVRVGQGEAASGSR